MSVRTLLISLALLLAISLGGTRNASADIFPKLSGPYSVGAQLRYWTDPSRNEDFNQPGLPVSSPRRLIVEIWYPAAPPEAVKLKKADYHLHSKELIEDAHKTFGIPVFMLKRLGLAKTNAYFDVPVAQTLAQYPVIIFVHGLNGTMVQNTFLCEELASHGYIVVSPEHTNAAIGTVFPDGTHAGTVDGSRIFYDDDFTKQMMEVWRQDNQFVFDQLEQLNKDDTEGLFTGRLDLSRIGIFGHSLGGASAAFSLMNDDRIKAAVNIDGFLPGKDYQVTSDKPFMEIRSKDNYTGLKEGFLKVTQVRNRTDLVFLKANHFSFTDLPLSFPAKPFTAPYIRKIHSELNAHIVDFFNKYFSQ